MKADKFKISQTNNTVQLNDIKHNLLKHNGINAVRFDKNSGTITVDYDEASINSESLKNLITQQGINV